MQVVKFKRDDILIDTTKVTAGFWSGGAGTLNASSEATFITSSLSSTQKQYYTNILYNSVDHFSALYGHDGGSGSTVGAINAGVGETQAIYNSYASYFLRPSEIEDGFKIYSTASADRDIYILVAERARMKDGLDVGSWTLALSGSTSGASTVAGKTKLTGSFIQLTDDSKVNKAQISPIGPRYIVRSGSAGTLTSGDNTRYGFFYPDAGTLILSTTALSASIPGTNVKSGSINDHNGIGGRGSGFAPHLANDGTANNAQKLFVGMKVANSNQVFRSVEDQTDVTYFCRALSRDFNHSANPTFISGSRGEYTISSFEGNPQTAITTVALLSGNVEVVAVGRLSAPLLKNYSTENIIKVKLSY